jgi:hypothetical protein
MHRSVLAAALLLAACGVDPSEDDRPRTFQYVTAAILKPSCGVAQCHSSFRKAADQAYDTFDAACKTMAGSEVQAGDPDNSRLYTVLRRTIDRMPYDQPMPEVDQALIHDWITIGAPGLPSTPEDCK